MAKLSEFEITRQSWCYFCISYRNIHVGSIECDGDEWTVYRLRTGYRTKEVSELFDKYMEEGAPTPTAFFKTGVLSSQTLRPCATRMPRRINK